MRFVSFERPFAYATKRAINQNTLAATKMVTSEGSGREYTAGGNHEGGGVSSKSFQSDNDPRHRAVASDVNGKRSRSPPPLRVHAMVSFAWETCDCHGPTSHKAMDESQTLGLEVVCGRAR